MKQQVNKFTLLELLVVIAIISILACILLPSLQTARLRSKEISCKSNQRQCGLSMQFYISDNNGILPLHSYIGAGSSRRWIQFLTEQVEYIKNRNITACPSFYPEKYSSMAYTYGAHMDNFAGAFVPAGFTQGPFIKVNSVPAPSRLWILSDSVYYDNALGRYIQIYTAQNAPTSNTQGGLHLRHLNSANLLFLDGHVKGTKRTEAVQSWGITKGYLLDCSLINL